LRSVTSATSYVISVPQSPHPQPVISVLDGTTNLNLQHGCYNATGARQPRFEFMGSGPCAVLCVTSRAMGTQPLTCQDMIGTVMPQDMCILGQPGRPFPLWWLHSQVTYFESSPKSSHLGCRASNCCCRPVAAVHMCRSLPKKVTQFHAGTCRCCEHSITCRTGAYACTQTFNTIVVCWSTPGHPQSTSIYLNCSSRRCSRPQHLPDWIAGQAMLQCQDRMAHTTKDNSRQSTQPQSPQKLAIPYLQNRPQGQDEPRSSATPQNSLATIQSICQSPATRQKDVHATATARSTCFWKSIDCHLSQNSCLQATGITQQQPAMRPSAVVNRPAQEPCTHPAAPAIVQATQTAT
jgi:hypothetical protein